MQIIIDTLEAARLTASPSDAMDLADAIADLRAIDVARGGRDLEDVADAVARFDAICAHVQARPFSVNGDDLMAEEGLLPVVDELTPGAFVEWLDVLEDLAS
jgi:hypothetical protein